MSPNRHSSIDAVRRHRGIQGPITQSRRPGHASVAVTVMRSLPQNFAVGGSTRRRRSPRLSPRLSEPNTAAIESLICDFVRFSPDSAAGLFAGMLGRFQDTDHSFQGVAPEFAHPRTHNELGRALDEQMPVHVLDTTARNVKPLGINEHTAGVTNEMLCPITLDVFNDPVMATDEQLYEREAIKRAWLLKGFPYSPVTGERLATDSLYTCHAMRKMIEDIAKRNGEASNTMESNSGSRLLNLRSPVTLV